MVAVFTGLRASELRGLRWADIDFDAGNLTVLSALTLGSRLVRLSLPPANVTCR